MNRTHVIQRAFALLLAMILAGTPLSPVFAGVAASAEAHVVHDGDHHADGSVQADHGSKTCTQHDSGIGQCCSCCAHCFGAVSLFQPAYLPSHPVQTPVLSQLHSFVLIASPDRPPRFLSL